MFKLDQRGIRSPRQCQVGTVGGGSPGVTCACVALSATRHLHVLYTGCGGHSGRHTGQVEVLVISCEATVVSVGSSGGNRCPSAASPVSLWWWGHCSGEMLYQNRNMAAHMRPWNFA